MMEHHPRQAREEGFTIIEVMVAMLVLLIGVLGTVTLIDTAASIGKTSRSREAATNLTRELVETAREIDYNTLLTATAPAALQSKDGLADDDTSIPGWQLERGGVMYTVTVESCLFDDPKDGLFAATLAAGYCDEHSATTDTNGDDYRKLTVAAAWGSKRVRLIANIVNPAGGFGPRITSVVSSPIVNTNLVIPVSGTTSSVDMTIGTTSATSLNWDAGDSKNGGQLTNVNGQTSWDFAWSLGTPIAADSYTCSTTVNWVTDAPAYQMTFQPFDISGTPGDLRTQTVAIDRSLPYKLCNFDGGRNPQHGGVIDLQWGGSRDGDVVSYSVWREKLPAEATDTLVCDGVRKAECTDQNPPPGTDELKYHVKPKQDNFALGQVFGAQTDLTIPAVDSPNSAPTTPGSVTLTPGIQPSISWSAATDTGGTILFYRIYRGGEAIANRYGKTTDGATLSFIDKDSGGASYSYYVSAVDNNFAESSVVPAS